MARRIAQGCAVAVVLVVLGGVGTAQAACTINWDGGAGTSLWSTGTNWDTNVPPASTDDVCIPAGVTTVTHDPAATSIRSLQLARTLSINNLTSLTITGTGATQNSQLTNPALISGPGEIHFDATSTLDKVAAGDAQITAEADLDGAVNINAGSLSFGIGADSIDSHAGTFTLAGGTTFAIGVGGFGTHVFGGTITDGANSATVTNGSGNLVTFSGTFSVQTLTNSGNLNLDGTTSPGVINQNAGNLNGTASYTVANALNWAGGAIGGTGTTTIPSTGMLDFQTSATKSLNRTLLNDAAVTLDVDGLSIGGVFDNRSGSTFTFDNDKDIGNIGDFFVRSGATLVKTGAGDSSMSVDIDWDGPVNINGGTLSLGVGSDSENSNDGTFTLANGTTFAIGVGGFGTHVFGGTITDGANSATVTNGSGNTVTFDGPLSVNALTNTGNLVLNGATTGLQVLTIAGGQLVGTASYSVGQTFNWSVGSLGGSGTTTIPSGSSVVFTTPSTKSLTGTRTLRNETAGFQPPADSTLNVGGSSFLDNAGTITLPDARDIVGIGTLRNLAGGTVQKNGAATDSSVPNLQNAGTVNVAQGTLSSIFTYTQTAGTTTVTGTLDPSDVTLAGGALGGGGTIAGDVTNSGGTVEPGVSPGILNVNGNYTQGAGGTLEIEIAGTIAGTQYDRLAVTGNATLDGTLAIVSSFTPASTDTFDVLTATGTVSGAFASLTGATTPGGTYEDNYVAGPPGKVTLALGAIPAPDNTGAPSIPSSAQVGDTLTCNPGTWTGSPTFAFQWLRDGNQIATGNQYTVTGDDDGRTLVCRVTGTNAGGSDNANSNSVVPTRPAPVNSGAPSIAASARTGDTLTCDPGTWSNSPSFAFAWLRDGTPITGATANTYVVTAADVGRSIVCRVTASNSGGSASADSNAVTPTAPPQTPAPPSGPPASPPADTNTETVRGPEAFTQGTSNDLYLACTRLDLQLIDVLPAGRRVSVTGTADVRLAGQTVEILLDGKRVGTATIAADGDFAARVRAPSRRRRARARYQARVGTTLSQRLFLVRRMVATTLTRSGDTLILRGRINKPFSRRTPIEIERFLSCQQRERIQIARVVPNRTGAFTVRIPVPQGALGAMYRARTRVPRRAGAPVSESTFTLPRAIDLV